MAPPRDLRICLDESMGRPLAGMLNLARAPGHPHIRDTRDMNLGGTSDKVLMIELANQGVHVLAAKDTRMLAASVRRDAWRSSGLTLFLLDGTWGNVSLFEQARGVFWWWPHLVAQAQAGPQGSAWTVPLTQNVAKLRRTLAAAQAGTGNTADAPTSQPER